MRDYIVNEVLPRIEAEHNITILYALESGSRMWGFPSPDSDYDVRFIYRYNNPLDNFSVSDQRDVVEYQEPDKDLDCSGWEVKKTIGLMMRGNGTVIDWLGSPIVYKQNKFAVAQMRMLQTYLTQSKTVRQRLVYHHRGLIHRGWNNGLKDCSHNTECFSVKKFLYMIRSTLLMRWFLAHYDEDVYTIPSPLPGDHIDAIPHSRARVELEELIVQKRSLSEKSTVSVEDFPTLWKLCLRWKDHDVPTIEHPENYLPDAVAADAVMRSLLSENVT